MLLKCVRNNHTDLITNIDSDKNKHVRECELTKTITIKKVHRECETIKNSGYSTSELRRDIEEMEKEKESIFFKNIIHKIK